MTKISKIAVVDDDASVRDALSGLVRSMGMEAVGFMSADEFVAAPGHAQFDCVITDVQMAGMSGIALLELLRKQQAQLPVIVMTAHPSAGMRSLALAAGAVDFLAKPFSGNQMARSIEQALGAV